MGPRRTGRVSYPASLASLYSRTGLDSEERANLVVDSNSGTMKW